MDDELTDEQRLLHDTAVRFIQSELPLAATRELHEDPRGYDEKWLARTAELGWYSLLVAEEHGGGSISGHGLIDLAVVADTIGRFVQPGPFISMNVVGAAVTADGTAEQRAALLPGMVAGEVVATWAPFDSTGKWDGGHGLTVTADGDEIVLRGTRGFVQDALTSDVLCVVGTLGGAPVQVLVPTRTAGVDVEPLTCLDLSRRMGEVTFDARLPAAAQLGGAGADTEVALEHQLQIAVVLACAETVGALDTMFEMTVEYSKGRVAFGRPIGSFQALKHVMADVAVFLEGCKAVATESARVVDAGGDDAAEVVSMAASYIDERATEIAQQCLQIHGGIGFTWEHDLHLLMRRARSTTSLWCDPVWHRERICEVHAL